MAGFSCRRFEITGVRRPYAEGCGGPMADKVTPSRRGRPRVDERLTPVSTRLPETTYDRLIKQANQQEKSVAAYVRELLDRRIP